MWNVLIAEDDDEMCAQFTDALKGHAHCQVVHDGKAALEAYEQALSSNTPFDCMLLDVTMPEINGFNVLRAIRGREEVARIAPTRAVLVIMVTAFKDSLMEHYNIGWDDFITKPVEADILIRHMEQLIKNRTLRGS